MDIEEQLDRAEKLPYPSLVGSSVKSADDSPHNNYIHPEKYTGNLKPAQRKKSLLNSSIGASLDDLISEGALMGSEEDFDRFLDDKGSVRSDAKYLGKNSSEKSDKSKTAALKLSEVASADQGAPDASVAKEPALTAIDNSVSVTESVSSGNEVQAGSSIYRAENFSTPNLSEYQLDHQISDHSQLLDSVKSYDLSKLPSSNDSELKSKSNDAFGLADRVPHVVRPSTAKGNQAFAVNRLDFGDNAKVAQTDSLHTPFFQRDERSPSRSRFPVSRVDRSRSRSTDRFNPRSHLARGDSYKNTHDDLPSKYELPADLDVDEVQEDDARESRHSRPTLGESVAAAEKEMREFKATSVTRDPSLVTSGDYTNFNADGGSENFNDKNLYSVRSESSTNYLRSISRSRSRQPGSARDHVTHLNNEKNEKNDANPAELVNEGAYVSDDPYGQVAGLDDMMKKVLTPTTSTQTNNKSQKNLVNDVSAIKKVTETKEQSKTVPVPLDGVSVEDKKTSTVDAVGEVSLENKEEEEEEKGEEVKETKGSKALEPTSDSGIEVSEKKADVEEVGLKLPISEVVELVDQAQPLTTKEESADDESDAKHAEKSVPADTVLVLKAEHPSSSTIEADEEEIIPAEPLKSSDNAADQIVKEKEDLLETQAVSEEPKVKNPAVVGTVLQTKEQEIGDVKLDESLKTEVLSKELGDETAVSSSKTEDIPKQSESEISSEPKSDEKPENAKETSLLDAVKEKAEELIETLSGSKEEDSPETSNKSIDDGPGAPVEAKSNTATEPISAEPASDTPGVSSAKEVVDENVKEPKDEGENVVVEEEEEEFFDVSPEELRKHLESLPIYLYTSLAGGMQIVNRTNRLTTILQANGIKFEYRDLGTDEEAKKIWRRYATGKTLPGVVRDNEVIGNWEYIEEVNEDYRLRSVLYESL